MFQEPFHCRQHRRYVVKHQFWIAALHKNPHLCQLIVFFTKLDIRWHYCSVTSNQNNHRYQRCSLLSLDNLWLCCSISSPQNLLTPRCLIELTDSPSIPCILAPLLLCLYLTWQKQAWKEMPLKTDIMSHCPVFKVIACLSKAIQVWQTKYYTQCNLYLNSCTSSASHVKKEPMLLYSMHLQNMIATG